jgi:anti-sigma regulatory factor (Ser/Thr protein kinase)
MAPADRPQRADTDMFSVPTDRPAVSVPAPPRAVPADPPLGGSAADDGGRRISLDQTFDRDALVALRSAVAAHGGSLGLTGERLELLVVVAHELASNAVRHGGGRGRLRLWRDGDMVCCRVSDDGPGLLDVDLHEPPCPPPVHAEGGRGLYFVRALADTVTVASAVTGTEVTASFQVN